MVEVVWIRYLPLKYWKRNTRKRKKVIFACVLDQEKAYDKVQGKSKEKSCVKFWYKIK